MASVSQDEGRKVSGRLSPRPTMLPAATSSISVFQAKQGGPCDPFWSHSSFCFAFLGIALGMEGASFRSRASEALLDTGSLAHLGHVQMSKAVLPGLLTSTRLNTCPVAGTELDFHTCHLSPHSCRHCYFIDEKPWAQRK